MEPIDTLGDIIIRDAVEGDIPKLIAFFDQQLSKDWFMFKGKWQRAITGVDTLGKYHTPHKVVLAVKGEEIIGLVIMSHTGKLFNLVVHQDYRGLGLGKKLIATTKPRYIRCKTDMKTGNPIVFYKKLGYAHVGNYDLWGNQSLTGKKHNIAWLEKGDNTQG